MLKRLSLLFLVALVMALAACGGAATDAQSDAANQSDAADHSDHSDHGDETHGDETHGDETHGDETHVDAIDPDAPVNVIPNNGAVIRIISPADGAVFKSTDEVLVEVEVENWELGVDGKHWHIVIDDHSEVMVMGGNTDQSLRNLTPGAHTLKAVMSDGDHADLEDGDMVTITIEE